jgi:hypothetical protein
MLGWFAKLWRLTGFRTKVIGMAGVGRSQIDQDQKAKSASATDAAFFD